MNIQIGSREILKRLFLILSTLLICFFGCSYHPHIIIETNLGSIEIELDGENAPKHTANFIKLVNEQYLVGTTFHRVIPGQIIQGGDPNSKDDDKKNDGLGGPAYTIDAEFKLKHLKWSIASARKSDQVNPEKKSSGSQFYICLRDLPQLDKLGYSVFGKVVDGFEIVEKISKVKRDRADNPLRRIVMERIYEK